MARPLDPLEIRAREMAAEANIDPDSRVAKLGSERGMPAWCSYRELARAEQNTQKAIEASAQFANLRPQEPQYQNSPLKVVGDHEPATLTQMRNCMSVGNVVAAALCADGHLGYAQPVGAALLYHRQISPSGVGFDIGCGNMAVKLDVRFDEISTRVGEILHDIVQVISFGIGRSNNERVEHELFDDAEAWHLSGMEAYRQKAKAQLGTVGAGNHYVDLFHDEAGFVWIGVHFGSRGTGHTVASDYLKKAGGTDGIHVPPAVIDEDSDLGQGYIAAMQLAGRLSYAGREAVVSRVNKIIGGHVTDMVHNHHNYAWKETHTVNGVEGEFWVVRKGATPAFPGQRGFVGGSMGDDAVIIEGVESQEARDSFYSTVHGAGRLFGRKMALRTFTRTEMDAWLRAKGVMVSGGDLDESPMAYRRLPDVLAHHAGSIKILHTLRPFAVAMAGRNEFDPWKD